MKTWRWVVGAVGLLLLLLAVWQILAAARGLEITTLRSTVPPLTLVTPSGVDPASRPLVLVGHGFAASGVMMRGFAFSLAHAGYAVALWDFDGHGANPQPLPARTQAPLVANAEAALAEAPARGVGDPQRVAIVGHSMGSGVAMLFGQQHSATSATIAISPVAVTVTEGLPHNLLLMAGSLEPNFVRSAEQLLAEAGGAGGDAQAGTARQMRVISGVEHVSILFSPSAHMAARDWLDTTFGPQPGARTFTDRRIRWYALGLVGTILVAWALAPRRTAPTSSNTPTRPLARRLGALAGGALCATLLLWLVGRAGLELQSLLGLLVGGYLMIWFALAGLVSILLLWQRPARLTALALWGGLLGFAALWLGVGLLGQSVWLPWLLIPRRLVLWLPGALLLLPWMLAVGLCSSTSPAAGRLGWWLAQSAVLVGGLLLAVRLSPDLGFLMLILPIFPIILGLHGLVGARLRGAWPLALSGALFTSWLLLAVFPLQ